MVTIADHNILQTLLIKSNLGLCQFAHKNQMITLPMITFNSLHCIKPCFKNAVGVS